jgi:hypothetical protein
VSARTPALSVALAALVSLAAAAGAAAAPTVARAGGEPVRWSPERMDRAAPLELWRGGAGRRGRLLRNHPVSFGSAEVTDPSAFPNSTNGRLFGELPGFGPFSCSATVLDSRSERLIFTAGHCVFDPFEGRFAKRLAFVPAYTDGGGPFGTWRWKSLRTTREWVRNANANFDFAVIKLRRRGGVAIEEVVGGRPLAVNQPRQQGYAAYGYPAAFAGGERMWSCLSGYAGKDPSPFRRGRAPTAIGCDMTGGASGGGWVTPAGLASVSSFGYRAHPGVLYGPYLGRKARTLVERSGG